MEQPVKASFPMIVFLIILIITSGCSNGGSPTGPTPTAMLTPVEQVLPTPENYRKARAPRSLPEDLAVSISSDIPYTSQQMLDVYSPEAAGDWPLVLVLHGAGDYKAMVSSLAEGISALGAVVFVPTWSQESADPVGTAFENAACAIRFARAHASEYGSLGERVIIVGYSAGAVVGAVMMLAGDEFRGDCLTEAGSAFPQILVGLDGGYDLIATTPADQLQEDPAAWIRLDPFSYIGRVPMREEMRFVLLVGSNVTLQSHTQAFRDALKASGYDVTLSQIPGINHWDMSLPQPETLGIVNDLLHP